MDLNILLEILKNTGLFGALIIISAASIMAVWKYFALQLEKCEKYFIKEKERYDGLLKEYESRILELHALILSIKEENIKKLEEANNRLRQSNDILSEKISLLQFKDNNSK